MTSASTLGLMERARTKDHTSHFKDTTKTLAGFLQSAGGKAASNQVETLRKYLQTDQSTKRVTAAVGT